MVDTITEKEADLLIEEGWIRAFAIFEVIGRPQEHVEKEVKRYIDTFIKNDIRIIRQDFEKPEKAGEDEHGEYFSVVGEVDFVVDNLEKLLMIITDFTPSHIEIVKPKKLSISDAAMTRFMNNLLQKIHYFAQVTLAASRDAELHKKSLTLLAMNAAVLALMTGPKTLTELAQLLGIKEDQLVKVMLKLQRKGLVEMNNDKYVLIKGVGNEPKKSS